MKIINIIIGLIIIIGCLLTSILSQNYFYNMQVTNCDDILNTDYQVSTGDVADCIRFNNYPFWQFIFPHYLFWLFFCAMLIVFQLGINVS